MADSGTPLLEQVDSSQAQHEITINALLAALSIAAAYGRHAEECAGLTWGYYGVRCGGSVVPNGTHVCADDDTTYMVMELATGAVSFSTSSTNWNDDATYGRCYLIVAAAGVITWEDHRFGPGGVIGPGIAGGGGGGSLRNTVNALSSTAGVCDIDWSLGDYFTLTPSEDITSFTFSNGPGSGKGLAVTIEFTQAATPRTVDLSQFTSDDGVTLTVGSTTGDIALIDIVSFDNGATGHASLSNRQA